MEHKSHCGVRRGCVDPLVFPSRTIRSKQLPILLAFMIRVISSLLYIPPFPREKKYKLESNPQNVVLFSYSWIP